MGFYGGGNRGGFGGGGMGNMQQMMKQAQKMQEEMIRKQAELDNTEIMGAAGGGMVEVVCMGNGNVKAVRIKPEAVDPDDVEMLEDLIIAAINEAQSKAEKLKKDTMPGMPGMF